MSRIELISLIITLSSIIGAISTAFYSFGARRRNIKNDIINDYETRMKQLELEMELTNKKLGEIKTMLDKREGELKIITDVLQGKNPETIIFMRRTTIMIEALMSNSGLPIPPIQHEN